MVIRDTTYTSDEFYEYMVARNDDRRFELIDGHLVEMPFYSFYYASITTQVGMAITQYSIDTELGYSFDSNCGYVLNERNVFLPKASFIVKERFQDNMPDLILGAPELAVEAVSPNENPVTLASIDEKTRLYFDTGAKVVWVIYTDEKQAEIRTPLNEGFHVITVGIDDMLHARSVLPDFELPLKNIFPKPPPTQEA